MQLEVAKRITKESDAQELGAKLKVPSYHIESAVGDNRNHVLGATITILDHWRKTMGTQEEAFGDMHGALKAMGRVDIISEVLLKVAEILTVFC